MPITPEQLDNAKMNGKPGATLHVDANTGEESQKIVISGRDKDTVIV